jgi:fatty-acyl-CoA synthase
VTPVSRSPARDLAYAHGAFGQPLIDDTIGANLARTAERFPDREALVSAHQDIRWTYAEFNRSVDALASGLLRAEVRRGDRVGIWSPNCAEWVLLQYATARIGAVLVTINPAYRTYELDYALQQSGVSLLIAAPAFKTSDYRRMAGEVAECQTVFLGDDSWNVLACGPVDENALSVRAAELNSDDAINIQYTSGTTGLPKGATLSHHNILNNGYFVAELLKYSEEDRVCLPVPFYHCFGMVMGNLGCTTHGSCIVIPAPSFDPAATLEAVATERCTSLYGVPTMFIAMLEEPGFAQHELSSLRTGIMAGAPCPVNVMRRVMNEMSMSEVSICYGMTETSPVSTQTRIDDSVERRVSTVGRVAPHVEIKIIDPNSGRTVPRGSVGELCTRGYSVMLGYWDDDERTAEAIDRAGWMHTGDLATMDTDGYVAITGRIKDMIIRGGENIYPREIEEFLFTHPEIADVQVIGVPDQRYGEELCAWVRVKDGATLAEADLRRFCEGRLAHYKCPRYILFVEDFPMTVTGKVRKIEMRERSIQLLDISAE